MTRINCVPVRSLTDKHLVAEYRELPRVFALVRRAQDRGEEPDMSGTYTLGRGHVRFFYPRLAWLCVRYHFIVAEMRRRGFTVNYPLPRMDGIHAKWFGTWSPTDEDKARSHERIQQRLAEIQDRGRRKALRRGRSE